MSVKIKCKSCGKVLKPDELEYKIGDSVIINTDMHPLSTTGVIEPYCKVCIIIFCNDDSDL